ncbi:uncharacterized protein LOC130720178 [Lotus japonicus]|uniref:uncharacterized protein LOC130720178 n=1 Tax=Lotus japonicus TaxID=34305 RepID=UPI002586F0F4|nr:uncharacterized protein LOC130720178 [Lotus japonicus]
MFLGAEERKVDMAAAKAGKEAKCVEEVEGVVSSVKCCCCGLVEECTQAYIARVKERFGGRWICGLCAEAVKEERVREKKMISMDEALDRHIGFCQEFRYSAPNEEDLVHAVKQILFRSLDSPRKERFSCRPLGRSQSCFSTMQVTTPPPESPSE